MEENCTDELLLPKAEDRGGEGVPQCFRATWQFSLSLSLSFCFEFCDDNILFPWCVAAELSLVLSPKQTVRCLHFLLAYCDEIAALRDRERERETSLPMLLLKIIPFPSHFLSHFSLPVQ